MHNKPYMLYENIRCFVLFFQDYQYFLLMDCFQNPRTLKRLDPSKRYLMVGTQWNFV